MLEEYKKEVKVNINLHLNFFPGLAGLRRARVGLDLEAPGCWAWSFLL